MADVEFEEQGNIYSVHKINQDKQTLITRLVIKFGLAKDKRGANTIFIVASIISLLLAVFIFMYFVVGYRLFSSKTVIKPEPSMRDLLVTPQTQK